jgi:putative two-component system response regulator
MGYTLVVDDEPEIAQLIALTLSGIHIPTRIAYDGKEAMDFIQQELPDLILLDLMMPRMTGFQLFAHLKSVSMTANIPVIVVSAYTDRGDHAGLAGAARIMPKGSFGAADIREAVTSVLGLS